MVDDLNAELLKLTLQFVKFLLAESSLRSLFDAIALPGFFTYSFSKAASAYVLQWLKYLKTLAVEQVNFELWPNTYIF